MCLKIDTHTHTHTYVCITCNLKFSCVSCSHTSKIYQTHYKFNKTHHLSIKHNFMFKFLFLKDEWLVLFITHWDRSPQKTLWYVKEYISQKMHLFPTVFSFWKFNSSDYIVTCKVSFHAFKYSWMWALLLCKFN